MLAWQHLRPSAGAPGAAREPAADDSVYESDEEEEPGEGEEEMKMVFCVRTDLKMSKGKAAAQCCHAAIGAFRRAVRANKEQVRTWERLGAAKITLKVQSEEDMFRVAEAAHKKGIVTFVVVRRRACALRGGLPRGGLPARPSHHRPLSPAASQEDAGRTQIPAGSRTVLALGPAPVSLMDEVTGPKGEVPLKLLS